MGIALQLYSSDVAAALDWYQRAFNFREINRKVNDDGDLDRVDLAWNDAVVSIADGGPGYVGPRGHVHQLQHLSVEKVDSHHERARHAGAQILTEPFGHPNGDRSYVVADLDGHRWAVTQPAGTGHGEGEAIAPVVPGHVDADPDRQLQALTDALTPFAIRAAVALGLADHIASGTVGLAGLAEAAGADPHALRRLLQFLACRGVFVESSPEAYGLTPTARLLTRDHPSGWWQWLDAEGIAGRLEATYPRLTESIRTAGPAYVSVHGLPFWSDLAADPERTRAFDRLMAEVPRSTDGVAQGYDWSGVRRVVDVGGGTGAVLAEILLAHPHLFAAPWWTRPEPRHRHDSIWPTRA
ncbi:hypothetical protein GCM10012275_47760 [Longimycelium tulufanense]|uniref:VOC domain-containing protein n=1 Tax=Longimycelium tulufanense TaxID=907463 RepID=A0A8J3CIG7_9PSEU|nr:VOC family protein [Longimycelium tulufanense]GGM71715.1 hypothetical protein GCM10012275_47760 [Longimycelium tulufanense]